MAHTLQTRIIASITELKRDPMGTVASGEGEPVAILSRNDPAFYCVPADTFEAMLKRLEDLELNALAEQRAQDGSQPIKVSLDAL